jgi:hypothetical protein
VVLTGLTGQTELMQLLCFLQVVCMHSSRGVALVQGELACVQGELACVQGELFVVFELWLVVCALCLSIVLSRMFQAVALA